MGALSALFVLAVAAAEEHASPGLGELARRLRFSASQGSSHLLPLDDLTADQQAALRRRLDAARTRITACGA